MDAYGGEKAEVRDVTGAVARRDVQAAKESNRQMREVRQTPRCSAYASNAVLVDRELFVAEGHMVVDEVTAGLHPRPAERRMSEEAPGMFREAIGLAVVAAEQELQDFRRQVLDLMLESIQVDRVSITIIGMLCGSSRSWRHPKPQRDNL
jgi:hypothetical protein